MKNVRVILTALSLSLAAMSVVAVLPLQTVQAADEGKVGVKVGKPLQEAQTAAQAKQWETALSKIREADAVADKTPFEQFKINEFSGYVYISQKKYGEAAAVYEKLLNSGFVPAEQSDQYVKQIAQMYMQVKNNAKASEYLQRWLKAHPGDADMTAILGQLQYQQGQLKGAMDTFSGLVSSAERAGRAPKEDWLKLMYGISYKMADGPGSGGMGGDDRGRGLDKTTLNIIEKLVRYYPSPTYWQALLSGLKQQQGSDAFKFQLDRLSMSVGALKTADEYSTMAQMANNLGYPGEALTVLESGYAKGLLGVGPGKEREERLRAAFKKAADTDKASLPAMEKKASAAATGQDDATLGEVYLGYGQYPQAIAALERGIKKGGLKKADQAQIALGIAYLRSNQADKARAAFKAVPAESELGRMASLWAIHAANPN